jgi:hypothetical protein
VECVLHLSIGVLNDMNALLRKSRQIAAMLAKVQVDFRRLLAMCARTY